MQNLPWAQKSWKKQETGCNHREPTNKNSQETRFSKAPEEIINILKNKYKENDTYLNFALYFWQEKFFFLH